MTSPDFKDGWCLVMALWGERYHAGYPNQIASGVAEHSPDCTDMVLLTDRLRDGIDPSIRQVLIPESFMKPEFFRGGYPVKLSIFLTPGVPARTRCVFVDLDTVVLGDLGRLAKMVTDHNDVLMLPPATLGFSLLSRWLYRVTGGKHYRTGNSSLLAFSSSAEPNIAGRFLDRYAAPETRDAPFMGIDDRFISWSAQPTLRAVPKTIAVMLRREFLSRIPGVISARSRFPSTAARRKGLAAITLNGVSVKPEALLELTSGEILEDGKGRCGLWGAEGFHPIFDAFLARIKAITTGNEKARTNGPGPEDKRVHNAP